MGALKKHHYSLVTDIKYSIVSDICREMNPIVNFWLMSTPYFVIFFSLSISLSLFQCCQSYFS